MRKQSNVCVAATLMVWIVTSYAGAAGKPLRDTPVNLWFGNATGDGVSSDGHTTIANGISADYIDSIQNVLAIIQSTGNFRFTTQNNTRSAAERLVCLDFGTQYSGLLPFGNGDAQQCVSVLEAMHNYPTGDVAIQSLRYGQSVQKLVRFTWNDGGFAYRLGYGSDMNLDGVMDSPPVTLTCIAPQNPAVACSRWLLAPSQTTGTAAFFRFELLKGSEGPSESLGTYSMPFSQTFTLK
jgi:hypothetical protein